MRSAEYLLVKVESFVEDRENQVAIAACTVLSADAFLYGIELREGLSVFRPLYKVGVFQFCDRKSRHLNRRGIYCLTDCLGVILEKIGFALVRCY